MRGPRYGPRTPPMADNRSEIGGARMKVIPLAAESLGVRSMATYVECGETRVLIDPGAMLAPNRFNLAPVEEEWEALRRANDRISADATRHIEGRQAQRAATLWRTLKGHAEPVAAEGRRLETADAVLQASPPLGHGSDGTALGYVVALTVEDRREGTRFVHASDVQGPLSPVAAAYLARQRPTLLYLSGPPAYLESQLGAELVDRGIEHLLRIIDQTGCRVLFDHHALRAPDYGERFRRLWDTGHVLTAAGFLGLPDEALESRRSDLWRGSRKPARRMEPRLKKKEASAIMRDGRQRRKAKGGSSA